MKTTTDMQLVPVSKLVPYVNNARTHSPEQVMKLRSSLREFGFINPIIIDRDYGIIAGHGRLLAAKEEGITEVPCVFVDYLTEAQKKAYILADNRMAMDAGWDEELLRVEIEALQGEAFDVSLTGFDEMELADLFKDGSDSGAEDDDYDLSAALEKAAFVERGDIWTVGRHRLMCGDATSAEDVAALMDDRKANLILTDPPYGVSFKSSSGLTIQNDSMKNEEFYNFLLSAFENMADHLEKGGAAYVFHADTEGLNFRRAFIDAGFHLAGCCIWVKDSLVLGRSDTNGSMSRCSTVSCRTESTRGTPTGSRRPSGTLPSPNGTRTTRPVSRSTCWAIPSGTPRRRMPSSSTPSAAAAPRSWPVSR